MLMVFLIGFCILTVAFVSNLNTSMRNMQRAHVKRDERGNS